MRSPERIQQSVPKADEMAVLVGAQHLAAKRRELFINYWPVLLDCIKEEMADKQISFNEAVQVLVSEFLITEHNSKLVEMGELIQDARNSGDMAA